MIDPNYKKISTAAKPRKKIAKYFAFILSVGKIEYAKTVAEARLFEQENADIITEKISFLTKKEFDAHKKAAHVVVTPTSKKKGTSAETVPISAMSPEDQVKMRAVLQRIEEERSGESLEVHYKTSSKATIVVWLLRFKNAEKKRNGKSKPTVSVSPCAVQLLRFPIPILQSMMLWRRSNTA